MSIKLKRPVIGDTEVNWTDYSETEKLSGLVTVEKATFSLSFRLFSVLTLPPVTLHHDSILMSSLFWYSWLLQVLSLSGLTPIPRWDSTSKWCLLNSHSSFFFQNQSSVIPDPRALLSFSLPSEKSTRRFSDRQRLLRLLPRRLKEDGLSRRPYLLCRLWTLR